MHTISIITVTYNAEHFIESTLKSVSDQTFTDYEHLIIDGASNDETLNIVQKYIRAQLKVFSEPDEGLYDAMNKAIQKATGEYIIFLNAGDVFYDEGTLTQVFTKSKGEDFIYGDTVVVDQSGSARPYHKMKPYQNLLSYRSFINGMVICHQSMIVKREKAVLFDNKNYKIACDIDWAIRTTKNCKTFLDTDLHISKFLDGGLSQKNKLDAIRERFRICVHHFGWSKTIYQQGVIVFQYILNMFRKNIA